MRKDSRHVKDEIYYTIRGYCTEQNGSDVTRNRGGCLVREINGVVTVTYKLSKNKRSVMAERSATSEHL